MLPMVLGLLNLDPNPQILFLRHPFLSLCVHHQLPQKTVAHRLVRVLLQGEAHRQLVQHVALVDLASREGPPGWPRHPLLSRRAQ